MECVWFVFMKFGIETIRENRAVIPGYTDTYIWEIIDTHTHTHIHKHTHTHTHIHTHTHTQTHTHNHTLAKRHQGTHTT